MLFCFFVFFFAGTGGSEKWGQDCEGPRYREDTPMYLTDISAEWQPGYLHSVVA